MAEQARPRYPKKFYILGHEVSLSFTRGPVLYQGQEVMGLADYSQMMIQVDTRVARSVQRETLAHELIHILEKVAGVRWMDFSDEESRVRFIENLFFAAMRERKNWPVIRFVTGMDMEG